MLRGGTQGVGVVSYRLAAGVAVMAAIAWADPATAQAAGVTYHLEMLQTERTPPGLPQRLKPLKTLQQVEDLLKANNIPFSWRRGVLPSDRLSPQFVQALDKLPPGEVFVVPRPDDQGFVIGVILDRK